VRIVIVLLFSLGLLSACQSKQAVPTPDSKIVPLPQERIQEMFDRIGRNEKIELALVYQALIGPQTALRADAARYLGIQGDETSILHLIDALADDSMHVGASYPKAGMATTRYWANESLMKVTGEDFGFVWNDPIGEREKAIGRWRVWYSKIYNKESSNKELKATR
jgi:hypothetical protein